MDQREQFSKWVQAVEEALSGKASISESIPTLEGGDCACAQWNCPKCFPEEEEGCPACGQTSPVCPVCGQSHTNQSGKMSPMSMPYGEKKTEGSMTSEFDGELDELAEPTLQSYVDKAGNRSNGMDSANARLDTIRGTAGSYPVPGYDEDPMYATDIGDNIREPDDFNMDNGPYGGRHDDYQSNLTARGFEEDSEPEVKPSYDKGLDGKGQKLGHIVQRFEPMVGADAEGEESPFTDADLDEEEYNGYGPTDQQQSEIESSKDPVINPAMANPDVDAIMYMQAAGLSMSQDHYPEEELYTLTPDQLQKVKAEVMGGQQAPMDEDDQMQNPPVATAGAPGGMQSASAAPSSGGQYAPGTAPTMPEGIQRGNTMENVDSDIARVMKGFAKYDTLKASKSIVSEKKGGKPEWLEDKEKEAEEKEGKKVDEKSENPWANLGKDDKKDGKSSKTAKGGEVTKTETGLKHKGTYGSDKKEVKESSEVDPEVLSWMARFSKLGNMKGYGR
jgi:hypothetical protein